EITPIKSSHQRYADVFGALGYPIELLRAGELPKQPLPRAMEKSMSETKKWVGIAPFAAFAGKTYPEHLMQRLIAELDALDTYQLFLFGGGGLQRQKLDAWAHRHKNCVSVAGKLDFADELDFISNLGLMLSMDSGNAHLAAMYGVPVVTLWGVTHPFAGFYPFGQEEENALLADRIKYPFIPTSVYGNKMPEGYDTAMETISTKSIVDKIEKLLV
ncbi:MAG: glycosyltransferase family 9 protein, partial [Flavobacteriaceae bacterium]